MIIGTGVDIVEIERFRDSHERLSLKILCEVELEIYSNIRSETRKVAHIAKRFAAKEAISKALGCGLGGKVGFKDIEISNDNSGKPMASITENVKKNLNINNKEVIIHLSLSDTNNQAIAFAIIECL